MPTDSPTTSEPTEMPSFDPTPSPTMMPTDSPTTSEPTEMPSFDPTPSPTMMPTDSPTTSEPTEMPTTSNPTEMPSDSPTERPSDSPTMMPTTSEPTMMPTTTCGGAWITQFAGETTCHSSQQLSKPCNQGCSLDDCAAECDALTDCEFFFVNTKGACHLYSECSETRVSSKDGYTCARAAMDGFCPLPYNTILGGKWGCDTANRVAKACKKDTPCTTEECVAHCDADSDCTAYHRNKKGKCDLFSECVAVRNT